MYNKITQTDIEALRDYLSCPYHPLNRFKLEDD